MADDIKLKVEVDVDSSELKNVNKNLTDTGKKVEDVGTAAKKSKTGLKSMAVGFKGIGTALKAAGIGIVLSVLAALFSLMKENQAVMDFMNKATKTLAILFNNLTSSLEPVGEAISAAFENPGQAVKDLWELIKTNFINRITAIPDLFTGIFETITSTFSWLGNKIKLIVSDIPIIGKGIDTEAAEKGVEDALQGMADGAEKTGESFLQMATGIDDLPGKLIGIGKAAVEGFDAATKAADDFIEKENELKLATAEFNKTIAENRLELQNLKLVRDDETASMEDRIKAAAEITKIVEDESEAAIKLQQQKIDLMKADLALTNTTIDDKIAISNAEAELSNIQAAAATRLRENLLKTNALSKKLEKEKDEDEVVEGPTPEEEAEIKRMVDFRKRKKELEDEWALEDAETDEEYQEELLKQEEDRYNAVIDNDKLTKEELEFALKEHVKNKENIEKDYVKSKKSLAKTEMQIEREKFGQTANIMSQAASLMKEGSIAQKALATGSAIINTYLSATAAIAPPPLGYGPTPLGYAAMAVSIGAGLVQVAKINQVQFADGGILDGPSHLNGGISTPFGELEGGEGVINASSMSNASLRNLASAANTAGGGKDFSSGDGSIKLDGGSISAIVGGINNKKVYLTETDMTETQEQVAVMEEEATI